MRQNRKRSCADQFLTAQTLMLHDLRMDILLFWVLFDGFMSQFRDIRNIMLID